MCKLCSFFKLHAADPASGTYKVLAICSSETNLFEPPRRDGRGRWIRRPWGDLEYNVFLAVVPETAGIPRTGIPLRWLESELPQKGSIYRLIEELREEEGMRLILPNEVGPRFGMADYWMFVCSNSHGPCCSPRKLPGRTVDGFRAIDCEQNPSAVENVSWREKYVVLSYVWGAPEIPDWPQTTKDAITVTKMLGYKYLWVDRLCIDQSNREQKKYLLSNMDAIFEGAEFTIVNASGDAQTGLPGVGMTLRNPQPRVELDHCEGNSVDRPAADDAYLGLLNVPGAEYDQETAGHTIWLDTYREGLNSTVTIPLDELTRNQQRMERYGIPRGHLDFYEDSADHFGMSFDEFIATQQEMARRMGMELRELLPFLHSEAGGEPIPDDQFDASRRSRHIITSPSKPQRPLPPGKMPGKTTLISTMQDPRVTIRESRWATRGWTYEEGVLSRRCLVFTPEQVYWECRGMAVNESVNLALPSLHKPINNGPHCVFADYMLSGILRGDMHRLPQLQYGFQQDDNNQQDVAAQVEVLDGHMTAYTSRELTKPRDSWNAFMGVAARYSVASGQGLAVLLGVPYLAGSFADGQPALQHSFAMSLSVWLHVGRPVEPNSQLYVARCLRRAQFPSWSWIGWEGRVDFNGDEKAPAEEGEGDDDGDDGGGRHNSHIEFFRAMTSSSWCSMVDRIWSAEMMLHSEDGYASTLLYGNVSLHNFVNPDRKWLLTIKQPLVLKHLVLMHSRNEWEWRRLMGKLVELHLSTPFTEEELTAGHRSGHMVSVMVFASTVPFVYDGKAQFLILKRVDASGQRWERVGRLVLTLEEWRMTNYKSTKEMIDDLPICQFGRDITIV